MVKEDAGRTYSGATPNGEDAAAATRARPGEVHTAAHQIGSQPSPTERGDSETGEWPERAPVAAEAADAEGTADAPDDPEAAAPGGGSEDGSEREPDLPDGPAVDDGAPGGLDGLLSDADLAALGEQAPSAGPANTAANTGAGFAPFEPAGLPAGLHDVGPLEPQAPSPDGLDLALRAGLAGDQGIEARGPFPLFAAWLETGRAFGAFARGWARRFGRDHRIDDDDLPAGRGGRSGHDGPGGHEGPPADVGGRGPDHDGVPDGGTAVMGGPGDDRLYGGPGDDALRGGHGDDRVYGGAGEDALKGGGGNDSLYGGAGEDALRGGGGNDSLYGGPGDDALRGGRGDGRLYGGAGEDALKCGGGNDSLYGGPGDDVLDGGEGSDVLRGGDGGDTFLIGPDQDLDLDVDRIRDFHVGDGGEADVLDLSNVITYGAGDDIADFVRTWADGGDTHVEVRPGGGAGGDAGWFEVAVLDNVVTDLDTLIANDQIVAA